MKANLLQFTSIKVDSYFFINPCSICLIGYLTHFPVKVSILAPVPERLHCDVQFFSDLSIFFWLYGQHKCCFATSRSPLETSHFHHIRISNQFPCLYISFQFQKMPHFHEVSAIFFKKLQKTCRQLIISRLCITFFNIGFCICSEDFRYRQAVSIIFYLFQSSYRKSGFTSLASVTRLVFNAVHVRISTFGADFD